LAQSLAASWRIGSAPTVRLSAEYRTSCREYGRHLGIGYPQARKWLNEAIAEIERKKIKKGIANFLETFLKEKLEKEQIKS
jgi:hypothetical protein